MFLAFMLACLIRRGKNSFIPANSALLVGLLLGLIATIKLTLFPAGLHSLPDIPFFVNKLRLDGLGLFFLFIVQLIAVPATIYNFSYLKHYTEQKKSVTGFLLFFIVLFISTQLLVIVNHAILFLIAWEVMTISAYLGMILEKEKTEVQKGSFYYFVISHFLIFILYIFFFILHRLTGSWYFSDYHLPEQAAVFIPLLFSLALIGFGTKAGLMPFHFWLPQAHPIAPSVLSAFLSGVLIKTGIYGLLRTAQFLSPIPEWCGWLVLIAGLVSAILGVWYALAQHDLKKLLAYHSVENIGIICMGIGIGFIGLANHMPAITILGLGGALFHTLNHAIFKSLLFIGSGIICQHQGTREIDAMGGLVHRARYIALLFLIGSIAICGIPPFNGFISEFIIFRSFFQTALDLKANYPLFMLLMVAGLAFVGGLAVACFTKINAVIFLGSSRKPSAPFKRSVFDHLALGILASLCLLIGLFPEPLITIINRIIIQGFEQRLPSPALVTINWSLLTLVLCSFLTGFCILYFLKILIEKKFGRRISPAWGCGYEKLDARMQYTASSFADQLNRIPEKLLGYHKKYKVSTGAFPTPSQFESHAQDLVDEKVVLPGFRLLRSIIMKIEFLSHPDIRYAIAFIVLMITIYCLVAFLWK